MRGIRSRGGYTATILFGRDRYPAALLFSTFLSRQFKNSGFKSARVFYEKGRLRIILYTDKIFPRKLLYYIRGRATIPLDFDSLKKISPQLFISPSNLEARKGSVSVRGQEVIVTFPLCFDLNPSFSIPKEVFPEKMLGRCYFYLHPSCHFGYLYFNSNVAQWFERRGVKGLQIAIRPPFLVVYPEKDCFFECKFCPRVDCLPLNINRQTRISVLGILRRYGYTREQLNNLPLNERKGKVFLTKKSYLLIELPFLKVPSNKGALFFLIFG